MRTTTTLVTILLAPLLVSGCTGGGTKNTEGKKLKYANGGTYTTAISADAGNLDPLLTSDQTSNALGAFAYDSLINIDKRGNPVRQLATKWQISPSAVTFTLDKHVTCADGSKLTASQVAANFDFVKNPANQSTVIGSGLPDTNFTVRADEAAGTVTITLAKPYGFLLTGAGLTRIVCAKGTANRKLLVRGTDGTGPFRLVEFVPSDHYTFVARKDYRWGPGGAGTNVPGFPDKVVFKVVQSETTANSLFLNGQLNDVGVVTADRKRLQGRGFYEVREPGAMIELFFNERSGHPGADLTLRKALAMGVDPRQLSAVITENNGKRPTDLEPNQPKPCTIATVPGNVPGHDPAAAKAALEAAGWHAGAGGVRAKGGTKLAVRLLYPGGTPSVDAGLELLAKWWKSLGAQVTLRSKDANGVQGELFGTGESWDVTALGIGVSNPSELVAFFAGPTPPRGQNFAAIDNPDYNGLNVQASGTPGKAGCDLWAKAEKALLRRVDVLPISISTVFEFGNKARFTIGVAGLEPTSLRLLAG